MLSTADKGAGESPVSSCKQYFFSQEGSKFILPCYARDLEPDPSTQKISVLSVSFPSSTHCEITPKTSKQNSAWPSKYLLKEKDHVFLGWGVGMVKGEDVARVKHLPS